MQASFALPRLSATGSAVAPWALAYVLIWSLLPPLLSASLPLDVVESLSWGREWEWGYYKHPPLAPWALELSYQAFGRVGPFLLSQLFIAATLWLVWRTGCRLMSRDRAFIGTLLTMGVAYYTRPALEFNHNIAQMPIWAALGYVLLLALQEGRLRYWLLLGLVAGLGLLTKYSVGILLATLALYVALTPARRVLLSPGPWLAVLVMSLIFAPHLYWLWQSDWLPMAYAKSRSVAESAHPRRDALGFLGTQLINHLPLALIALVALWSARVPRSVAAEQAPTGWRMQCRMPGYLLALAVGSGLLVTLLGVATGLRLRDMWGAPMWCFSGLLVAASLPAQRWDVVRVRLLRGLAVWLLLISAVCGAFLAYGGQWRQRPARTDWPEKALVEQVQAVWRAQSRCALDSISSDYWTAGLIAAQLPERPSVYIAGDDRFSPWISLARLQSHGTLWLELGDDATVPLPLLAPLAQDSSVRIREGKVQVDWPFPGASAPLTLHWRTYVPAACVNPS